MARFFDWFLLGALGCFICLAAGRALLMRRRGIHVAATPTKQSRRQRLENFLNVAVPLARSCEIIAYAWPVNLHLLPRAADILLIHLLPLKILGAVFWIAVLAIYAAAVGNLGDSWRIGIEKESTCPLVTTGVFRWTRNPIFLSFGLMAVGTFLVLGRLVFLLLAMLSLCLIQSQVRREEKFLRETFGADYQAYCSQVARYLKLPGLK